MAGIHEGDFGTLLQFTVVDENGAVVNLTGYNAVSVRLKKPCGDVVVKTGVVTAPATGVVEYTVQNGDIVDGDAGVWKAEVKVDLPTGKWTSSPVTFAVKENI